MSRLLAAAIPSLLVSLALAPAAPVPEGAKNSALHFPTKKETRWVYLYGEKERTFVVTDAEEREDAVVVSVAELLPGGREEPERKLAVSRRGVLWLANRHLYDEPVWLLKQPVRVGQAWDFRTSGPSVIKTRGTMRVAAVETVEVPAGKFTAVRVEEEKVLSGDAAARPLRYTYWFSPGVGVVKLAYGGAENVLKEFTPGKE